MPYQPPHSVPAEPFVRIMHEWWEKEKQSGTYRVEMKGGEEQIMGFYDTAGTRLNVDPRSIKKYETGHFLNFDTADKIVTNFLGAQAWYTDPELNEIYMSFDLNAFDWAVPVSRTVWEKEADILLSWFEEHEWTDWTIADVMRASGASRNVAREIIAYWNG